MFAASKTASVSGGYQISRSLRFNSADSAYLNRTPASAGNRKTWTFSAWVKLSALTGNNILFSASNGSSTQFYINFSSANTLDIVDYSGSTQLQKTTTQLFRDPSAFYHLVVVLDTTQASASNRFRLYINGLEVTAFSGTNITPSQNYDGAVNSTVPHAYGRDEFGDNNYYSGYLTETYLIDGQALTPSSFGSTNADTGVWQPKAYSGSYGTNGFYLNFSDNSNTTAATLGKDYSGNGNNWTPNNFSVTAGAGNDSLVDSPTSYGTDTGVGGSVRGNYATWNAVGVSGGGTSAITNGNLDASVGSTTTFGKIAATFGLSTGKWYWEVLIVNVASAGNVGISSGFLPSADYGLGGDTGDVAYQSTGNKYLSGTGSAYGSSYTSNDIIGVAYDADAGSITFYKNNTSQGAITGFTGTKYPAVGAGGGSNPQYTANFGQRPFAYTAPSGFKALCTQNLPTPTIGATTATTADKYFGIVLRNGTGTTGGTFSTTVNMANGAMWWEKPRSNADQHQLVDSVRGVSKYLIPNSTAAEGTAALYVTAFGTNSYTIGTDDWPVSRTIVDWMWAANGSGSTNTAGSITSTVSANTTSGFSVVTWTATGSAGSVGHGLGVAPAMVIYKARGATSSWVVIQQGLTNMTNNWLKLNTADPVFTGTFSFSGAPTSSVFYSDSNFGSGTMVSYCFAEIAGYSKISSYTGNGSSDGVFVYCGFRPAYVMIKETAAGYDWFVEDATRDTYNVAQSVLSPNTSSAEATGSNYYIDFLSNGFKIRSSYAGINANGVKNIFAAFASSPFKYSLAR